MASRIGLLPVSHGALFGALIAAGCGRGSQPSPHVRDDAAVATAPARDAAVPSLPPLEAGRASPDAFLYRKRAGHAMYRQARKAEAREDWAAVVAACERALALDADHLDAAWLLAVAYAKTGANDRVLAPLRTAIAGDFVAWSAASLTQPALATWRESPIGVAWRAAIADARRAVGESLQRSIVVSVHGELFAFDPVSHRWLRLTRTGGSVVAALAPIGGAAPFAFVTHTSSRTAPDASSYAVGVIDPLAGRGIRPVAVPVASGAALRVVARAAGGFAVGGAGGWRAIGEDGKLAPAGDRAALDHASALVVFGHAAWIEAAGSAPADANWDDHRLASAIRIGESHRVVSAPDPELIDGRSLALSPDRAALAFVAVDDRCPDAAHGTIASSTAFVTDVATGRLRSLATAHAGLAVQWVGERSLAVASERGVSIIALDTGEATTIDGATDLALPRRRSRCASPDEVANPGEPTDAAETD